MENSKDLLSGTCLEGVSQSIQDAISDASLSTGIADLVTDITTKLGIDISTLKKTTKETINKDIQKLHTLYDNISMPNIGTIKEIIVKRNIYCQPQDASGFITYYNTNFQTIKDNNEKTYLNVLKQLLNTQEFYKKIIPKLTKTNSIYSTIITENIKTLNDIEKNIGNYAKLNNVDLRKVYYTNIDLEKYISIYTYIIIIYFIVLVLYFIFGDIFSKKRYKDYRFYILLILYIIFPFILKYILFGFNNAYDFILNYFNLSKPIYSNIDILQASNLKDIYTAPLNTPAEIEKANINYYNNIISKNNFS